MGPVCLCVAVLLVVAAAASASQNAHSEKTASNEVPEDDGESQKFTFHESQISTATNAEKEVVAYKNTEELTCYIEKIQEHRAQRVNDATLFASTLQISQKKVNPSSKIKLTSLFWGQKFCE
ncbi:uncharacterized protein [Bemisia tabaci]|uniref:uncharacterized protein n=1 Tax=Bemisia tabaci TaxID=7038 RepID=UPI003B28960F